LRRTDTRAEIHTPADFGAIILPLAPDPASRPQAAESPHRQEEQSEASRFWSRARVWHPHAHVHARGACRALSDFIFVFLPDLTAGGNGFVLYYYMMTGRHVVVPRARGTSWLSPLLDRHRHVVGRMYLCGDGHARHPALPWRLGNRPNLQDLPVSPPLSLDVPSFCAPVRWSSTTSLFLWASDR